jgi:peptide/nickel transport system permease protein
VLAFALRRLGAAAIVVAVVVTRMFALTRLRPGAPMIGDAERLRADPARVERLRARFGLDQPIGVQFARYVANVARGDLGESFVMHRPVAAVIRERLPNTLLLAGVALLLSIGLGLTIAALQATRPGTAADGALGALAVAFYSMPGFWLGMVLLFLFSQSLGWFPVSGMTEPVVHQRLGPAGKALDVLRHMVLPALTLALVQMAAFARFGRSALLDALASEHVRAARAGGLSPARLLRRALRTSLAPIITIAGTGIAALLAGSVLVETIFGWPGMGRLTHDAIFQRDYNLVAGNALVAGVCVALANFAADLAAHVADPRLAR